MTEQYERNSVWDEIAIDAPVGKVWEVLERFGEWPAWNPLYVEARGEFAEGNVLEYSVALPGMKPQRGRATVLALRPAEYVRYQTVSLGGLVRATRFIELRPDGPDRCVLVNGETMGGLLGPLLFRAMGERVRQGLQGMNEALRARL